MIENRRLQNLQKQSQTLGTRTSQSFSVEYQKQDKTTGARELKTASGGTVYASYIANSRPNIILTSYDRSSKTVNQKSI